MSRVQQKTREAGCTISAIIFEKCGRYVKFSNWKNKTPCEFINSGKQNYVPETAAPTPEVYPVLYLMQTLAKPVTLF